MRATLALEDVPGVSGTYSVEVPPIELEGLSSEGEGRTLADWAGTIVSLVVDRAARSGEGVFPAAFLEGLQGQLAGLKDRALVEARQVLEDVQERGVEAVLEDAGEKLEKAKEGAGGALKGLLGKDRE